MVRAIACLLAMLAGLAVAPGMAESRSLTVYYFDRPPYYLTEQGKPGGFLLDLAQSLLRSAGVEFAIEELPAPRILEELKEGRTPACGVGWFKTADRESFARFSLPIYQDKPFRALFLKTGKRPPDGVTTFKDLSARDDVTLGVIEAFSYGSQADGSIASMVSPPVRVNGTQAQLVRMLAAGRFDYMLVNPEETATLARQAGVSPEDLIEVPLTDLPKGNLRYLMFSRAVDDATLQAVNAQIKRRLCVD